jgi:hypothetical protein
MESQVPIGLGVELAFEVLCIPILFLLDHLLFLCSEWWVWVRLGYL